MDILSPLAWYAFSPVKRYPSIPNPYSDFAAFACSEDFYIAPQKNRSANK